MKTYEHGGDINGFAKKLNCKIEDIIDLSSNINFIKPKIDTNFNTLEISSYPKYDTLYKTIAKNYKIKEKNLELFNGGSSGIFTLFRHLKLKNCVIYSPAYLEYKKAADIYNYKTTQINRFKNIYKDIPKNSLVIFVNPSTPDGKHYDLKKLFKIWKERDATVLIDESFLDFTNQSSSLKYLKEYKKLYILKSLTKFYSSAGIRLGIIISNRKNIDLIKKNEPMWKISQFDSRYIQEALKDKEFKNASLNKNDKNRKSLLKLLKKQSFIKKVYESEANFFLVKLKNIDAEELQNTLLKYKIMIRDCSNFTFLDNSYVRIAVKNQKSINILKKAFKEI
ncbi:aminotransferase class I/II-fold pyridoxal phosphate-dependent enzyme [Arcobacter sp. LA11]|uniref:aminotransferase class I/II-fold pyridoxal phosphate-dependent enzyme n=1 Tax=Arcobacter sp. LA11 TaxID=1898176 RepID=UPI000933C8BA|nr:aminotransferase class I/II-fold pyridoxal phosphate-dependent enzyme [Arcobacter sp. LA11]